MNNSAPAGGMTGGINSSYGHDTKRLIGSSIVLITLSTIFVALRLVSRKLSKAGFWVRFPDIFLQMDGMLTVKLFFLLELIVG